MCDRYVVGEIQGYDVIYIPEKDIVFCKNTAIKLSVLDDLTDVCRFIEASHIAPAFMAEIIEKVKSMMVLANQCEVKADDIKYSVQSYLRQVELSRTKDMSVTPEKKFVDALLEVLHIEKNEKTFATFIRMMESAHGEEMSEYEEK